MQDITSDIENYDRFLPVGATLDYLDEVDESIREIDLQRPLPSAIIQKLEEEILYDRVYSSAVIEGNRLSRRETIAVLSSGILEAGSRKEQQEVINLADCCFYLQECLDRGEPLSIQLIKELHQKLLNKIDCENAGRFRSKDVAISGASVLPPSHLDVPNLVEKAISTCNSNKDSHPVQNAAYVHWAFTRIHPFVDGNGRLSRLLQDFILLKARYVPATVQPEDRERNYYDALEQADQGDGLSFLEITAKNTLRTADRYLSIIRTEKAKTDWIKNIARAASEKVKQTDHRKFISLQKNSEAIKLEFSNICKLLSEELSNIRIGFKDYGGLDFEKWQNLRTKGKAPRTWLFGLHINGRDIDQRYIFWHGRHIHRADDTKNFDDGVINLLVSVQDSAGGYKSLDEITEDRIALREIVLDGRVFMRRRYNPTTRQHEWDEEIAATEIASQFIQEAFSKLGLI
ncbi:Fic family protein [Bordetella hinzii]|uniref:Fic family protein n=1 Tax=Bordetella hinzii TaxID=103855 RepID=UPI0009B91CC6|nr:Fic family protein [Bordetella hinzii]QDJ35720.1 cell filamentation protein Fic [Bordetella hinzii]VEH32038.1 Protein involved in cell division [Bordetella hinzii]